MVISRRSPEILSFYVAESARALTEFEMTKRRHDEFSDHLAAAKASRLISDGKKCCFVLLGGTSHSLQERFLALRRDNTCKLFLDAPRNLSAKRSTLSFYLLKSAGNRPSTAAKKAEN
jgi:hypothetical protein